MSIHEYTHEDEIEYKAKEFSEKYLNEHKETAREGFLAGVRFAYFLIDGKIEQYETALEVCNNERKEIRDDLDESNAAYATLEKKYNSLLAASSLML